MTRLNLHQPLRYRLMVSSHVDGGNAGWPANLVLRHNYTPSGIPITTLEGAVPDQTALHSLLTKIRDLGLPLIAVNCLDVEERENHKTNSKYDSLK